MEQLCMMQLMLLTCTRMESDAHVQDSMHNSTHAYALSGFQAVPEENWYQHLGIQILVRGTWYRDLGARKVVPISLTGNSTRNLILRQQFALRYLQIDFKKKTIINIDETWLGMSDFRRRKWMFKGTNNSVPHL